MRPVSRKVAALGFDRHPDLAYGVKSALASQTGIDFLNADAGQRLESIQDYSALLLGPDFDYQAEAGFETIRKALSAGHRLVVLALPAVLADSKWHELLGARPTNALVGAEWIFKIKNRESAVAQRLSPEFPGVGSLSLLETVGKDSHALLVTSVGFNDYTSATLKQVENTSVSVFGLSPTGKISDDMALLIGRTLLLDERRTQANKTLGVGIVGFGPYGGMGHYHGKAVSEVDGLELVAVVDRDQERRKAAEFEFPNIRTYRTTEELAEDGEVDICIVATPPSSHAEISMALLDSNKHVISEKPMCLTYHDATALVKKAREMNKMLTVNQNRRWDGDYLALTRAVSQGRLGEVFNFETFVGGFDHPCRAWHSDQTISGGAIYDWGSHYIDWIVQLYGKPPDQVSSVSHKRVWHDITNADQVRVHMLWDDGREAEFFHSDIAAIRKPKYFLQGTQGTIVGNYRTIVEEHISFPFGYIENRHHHAEAPVTLKLSRYESQYGLIEETLPPEKSQPFAFHRNVANHLLLGEELEVEPSNVAEVIGVLEAAQKSSVTGSQYLRRAEK